jgi:MFS family permease
LPRLRSDTEFRKLWLGQSVSEIGSWVSTTALPITAVVLLGATPAQMGILSAVAGGSTLLVGLFAGVLADRMFRRPVLIWSDIARALLLATIPLAATFQLLTYAQLLAISAATGVITVFFNVAYQSYLPALIAESDLPEGNRLLGMSSAAAEVIGPLLAGILIKIVTPPIAILLDAASFVVSAASVAAIHRAEPPRVPRRQIRFIEEALAGAIAIRANPLLSVLALRSITACFFGGMIYALYILYAVRNLRMSTAALGLTIALGGVGSIAGSYYAERIAIRLGIRRAFFVSALSSGLLTLLIPLSTLYPSSAVMLLCIAQLFGDAAASVYITNKLTFQQRVTSGDVLGRVNAAMQIASQGMVPLGALAGGFLASAFGIPATLWVSAGGIAASCLWLLVPHHARPQLSTLQQPN